MACPEVKVRAELGLESHFSSYCPRSGISGQDPGRGLGIKQEASELEVLAQERGGY